MRLHAIPMLAALFATATGCASRAGAARTEAPTDSLYVDEVVPDPWERFNRRAHEFNAVVDRRALRPIAIAYNRVLPDNAQAAVSRFFSNLRLPATAINQVIQGRPLDATRTLGRFAVNTTAGAIGLGDPASRFGLPASNPEDLGLTLAQWGWKDSRYVVLPILGPATLRDALGIAASGRLSPVHYIDDPGTSIGVQLLQAVDARARLLSMDEAREEAHDEYALIRDVWAQRRQYRIDRDRSGRSE